MAYLAPNPATFDHSDFGYVAQNPATFDHTIVVSTITVSSSSVIVLGSNAVGTNSISLVDVSPVAQGFILPVTASTINLTSTPIIELGNNEGGRIALLAVSNFDPPQGDQIVLQSTTGHWIHAREPKATVASTVELTGAAVIMNEPAPDITITAELSGSVVYVTNDIPVVSSTVVLTGASIVMVDAAPLVSVSADIVRSLNLLATFNAPTLLASISGAQNECLLNKSLPTLVFSGVITQVYQLSLNAELPVFKTNFKYAKETSLGFNVLFPSPTLTATSYNNSVLSLSAIVPVAQANITAINGEFLSLDTITPVALSDINFSGAYTLEMRVTMQPPIMTGSFDGGFNLSTVIPGFIVDFGSVSAGLSLSGTLALPVLQMSMDNGYLLSSAIPKFTLEAGFSDRTCGLAAVIEKIQFKGVIIGGTDNFLNATLPLFNTSFNFNNISNQGISAQFIPFDYTGKITSGANFNLNSVFIVPALTAGNQSDGILNEYFNAPILEAYIGTAPIEFI